MKVWMERLRARDRRAVALTAGAAALLVLLLFVGLFAFRSESPAAKAPPTLTPPPTVTAATPPAGTPFRLITPGPTVPAGHWRWRGAVVDVDDKPIEGVCVHIGPGDCRFNSIRTDEKGQWVIDFPQVDVFYDFHFIKEGYRQVDDRIRTQAPGDLRTRMVRS